MVRVLQRYSNLVAAECLESVVLRARGCPARGVADGSVDLPQVARRLDETEVGELVNLYSQLRSVVAVAERVGLHEQTVRGHLRARGVTITSRTTAMTADQVGEAVRLYQDGWSSRRIASQIGSTSDSVLRELHRADVEIRTKTDHLRRARA